MILYEFEGKDLLKSSGIAVPESQLINSPDEGVKVKTPCMLKAQVLSGKRAQEGGIIKVDSGQSIVDSLERLFGKTINGEKVGKILIEELVDKEIEYYLSISYDTDSRSPVLSISESGGTGIEEREVKTFQIDPIAQEVKGNFLGVPDALIGKLVKLFFEADCLLLEINPLVKFGDEWVALDAKVKLDDDARFRHEDWDFPPRGVPGKLPTNREIEAKKIDEGDYRGVAGSTYFDLEGDIAIMASGGGISLTGMDALLSFGAKPANFTEYSGNPPKEKVTKLTKIVLDKENIHGLWVIGTVAANFTDIYETLLGLIEGLRQAQKDLGTKFNFPIVIRRGGPREKEAFEMLKGIKDFNLILQGEEVSVTESAQVMAEEAKKYAASK